MILNRTKKIEIIQKFITESIYNLEKVQKEMNGIKRLKLTNQEFELVSTPYIKNKSKIFEVAGHESFIRIPIDIVNYNHVLTLLNHFNSRLSLESFYEKTKRRFFVFINGIKVKDKDIDILLDTNKTYLIFKNNSFDKNTIEFDFIIFDPSYHYAEVTDIIDISNTFGDYIVFDEGKVTTEYTVSDGNISFKSPSYKEIYFIPTLDKQEKLKDFVNGFFRTDKVIHAESIMLFCNGELDTHGLLKSNHNTSFQILNYDDNNSYVLFVFDSVNSDDKNRELDIFLSHNKDDLIFNYINNLFIPDKFKDISIMNFKDYFNLKDYLTSDKALDRYINDVINLLIYHYPDLYKEMISSIYPNYKREYDIFVNEEFKGKRLRTSNFEDNVTNPETFEENRYMVCVTRKDGNKFFNIHLDGRFYVPDKFYWNCFGEVFAYIPESELNDVDIINVVIYDEDDVPSVDIEFYPITNSMILDIHDIEDLCIDDLALFHINNDDISHQIFSCKIKIDFDKNDKLVIYDIPSDLFGKKLKLTNSKKNIFYYDKITETSNLVDISVEGLEIYDIDPDRVELFINGKLADSIYIQLSFPNKYNDLSNVKFTICANLNYGDEVVVLYNRNKKIIKNDDCIREDGIIILDGNMPYNEKIHDVFISGLKVPSSCIDNLSSSVIKVRNFPAFGRCVVKEMKLSDEYYETFDANRVKSLNDDIYSDFKKEVPKKSIANIHIIDDIQNGNLVNGYLMNDDGRYDQLIDEDGIVNLDLSMDDKYQQGTVFSVDFKEQKFPTKARYDKYQYMKNFKYLEKSDFQEDVIIEPNDIVLDYVRFKYSKCVIENDLDELNLPEEIKIEFQILKYLLII